MLPRSPGDPLVELIASRQNPLVARFRRVAQDPGFEPDTLLLDGRRLVEEAHAAGLEIFVAAFSTGALERDPAAAALADALAAAGRRVARVTDGVMNALSPVRTPSGVAGLAARPAAPFDRLFEPPPALVVLAVDIQDPGNVGAIVRVAAASGATGVVVAGASADPFGWKALRGAMGSTFQVPVIRIERTGDAVAAVRARRIRLVGTAPREGRSLYDANLTGPLCLMVGSEGGGIAPDIARQADETISIPMRGPTESLNVAVATGICLFEARRQALAGSGPAARPRRPASR